MSATDVVVTFPSRGVIRLRSRALFGDADRPACRRFIERVFQAGEVEQVAVSPGRLCRADVHYAPGATVHAVVGRLVALLKGTAEQDVLDGPPVPAGMHGFGGTIRYCRQGSPATPAPRAANLPLCTAALPIAAAAQFAFPPLMPAAAALFVYTSLPTLREARDVILKERRLGVGLLDAVVVLGCLGTMSIFAGALLCWCGSLGRVLARRTQDESRKLLEDAIGNVPEHAWLYRDGAEVRVPLERVGRDDILVVSAGEVVPVDGDVVEGFALVDAHALTGAAAPAETGIGDQALASTAVVAGRLYVSVAAKGDETASARVRRALGESAGRKLDVQRRQERLADRAVLPTLALGAIGMATVGPAGGLAVLKSHVRGDVSPSAPLALLGALSLCASRGIVIRDPGALERLHRVDTVVFDRAALIDGERLEVASIGSVDGFANEELLRLAAAAEQRFHHPIALALLRKAGEGGLALPAADDVVYRVGLGIAALVDGYSVRVGSRRFLERERIALPSEDAAGGEGDTTVWVAVDDRLAGTIELRAPVRTEARAVVAELRRQGIRHVAVLSPDGEPVGEDGAELPGLERCKPDAVDALRREGQTLCFVGAGTDDVPAPREADVRVSLRGAASLASDPAPVVLLEPDLAKLLDLRAIARDLNRNLRRSRALVLAPGVGCIAGVFTLGLGITASILINNLAALAALANDALPLREVARNEAERQHRLEVTRGLALARERLEA